MTASAPSAGGGPVWLRRIFEAFRRDCRARKPGECDGPWVIAYTGSSNPAGATCKLCGARWKVEGETVKRLHEPKPEAAE